MRKSRHAWSARLSNTMKIGAGDNIRWICPAPNQVAPKKGEIIMGMQRPIREIFLTGMAPPQEVFTLKSKLTPPRLLETIERGRLTALLDQIRTTRVVTITAGAGYGKSTFAAQVCRGKGLKCVWYSLDAADGDIGIFLHYLIAGIRQHCAGFGERTLARLRAVEQERIDPNGICTLFLHEIEQCLEEHLLVALDDFHLIQEAAEIQAALHWMLRHLPENLHFLIVSRQSLPPEFSCLIAARQALAITQADLAFTPEEADDLYRKIFHLSLSEEALRELAEKTGGWAAALILLRHGLADSDSGRVENQLVQLNGNFNLFEDYLDTTLFQQLSEEIRAFLVKTSVLNELAVDFCDQLLGIENAGQILGRLEKEHLFTFSLDPEQTLYRYHHLFHAFLKDRFKQDVEKADAQQLHGRAALLWEQRGDLPEAIGHYLNAQRYEKALDLLVRHGPDLMDNGRVHQVLVHCRQIPDHLQQQAPQLTYLIGNALLHKWRIQEAEAAYEKARRKYEAQHDQIGAGRCLSRLATCALLCNDFVQAEALYTALLAQVGDDPEAYAISLGGLISVSALLRKIEQTEHYLAQTGPILQNRKASVAHAWIYIAYANARVAAQKPLDAIHYAQKAVAAANRHHNYSLVIKACQLMSFAWNSQFEYEKGLVAALQGIRTAEAHGFRETGYAWCLIGASISTAGLGHTAEALAYGDKALSIFQTTQSDVALAWAYLALCNARLKAGELDEAEAAGRRALNFMDPIPLVQDKALIQIILAWTLAFKGQFAEALALARAVEKIPDPPDAFRVWTTLLQAFHDQCTGRREAARAGVSAILDIASARMLQSHVQWMLPLLVELRGNEKYRERIEALLDTLEPADGALLKAPQSPVDARTQATTPLQMGRLQSTAAAGPLKLFCFGTFRIYRDGDEIASSAWGSSKAKMLLKYLAFHHKRGFVPKEELLELLWPEQDPRLTGNRLHVALTTLRKALEPDLVRGARSTYILRENDRYRLHPGDDGFLDVAAFDNALNAAAAADPHRAWKYYLEAESLYKGDIFGEEPYIDWCEEARTQYREKYLRLLHQIAEHHATEGDLSAATDYLQRALRIDAYAEEDYCRLMILYLQGGNRPMALKMYEQCRQKVEIDLQCPLSDETLALYRRIAAKDTRG